MGGFTIYRINYPATRREEVLFGANLSIRNVMLECMLKANTSGFRAGLVSVCPECLTSILRRQPFLNAAQEASKWLSQLPPTVQAFTDLITMVSGDNNYERRWAGGYSDRQVAEAKFSQLVKALGECKDEFIYLEDDYLECEHEDWCASESNVRSKGIINELGFVNPETHRRQEPRTAEMDWTIVLEPRGPSEVVGFAVYRISRVEVLFFANLAVCAVMGQCMITAGIDVFNAGSVSRCPDCMTSVLRRQPFLKAAEETLDYVRCLPARVQDFPDLMEMMTGDSKRKWAWEDGDTDRQVAEMMFSGLVQALRECQDEEIYVEVGGATCAHERWRRP